MFLETRTTADHRQWQGLDAAVDTFVASDRDAKSPECFRFVMYDARDICAPVLAGLLHTHADALVGIHGAGNTNAIFMDRTRSPRPLLVQVVPETVCAWPGTLYYRSMAIAAGLGYQTFCVPASRTVFIRPVGNGELDNAHTMPKHGSQHDIYNIRFVRVGAGDIKHITDNIVAFRA